MIGAIIGGVTSLFTSWNDVRKAKIQTKLAVETYRQELALSKEQHNQNWELASLAQQDKLLRRVCFFILAAPLVIAFFFPEHISIYFKTSINAIPLWWQKTFMAVVGGVWGLAELKDVVPGIVSAFRK